MRVLLAEDNLTNEKVARQLLAKLGHTSVTATNGLEVLEVIKNDRAFDCILMDIAMPEMDGIETTQRLIETIPDAAKRPPIIALTANAFDSDRKTCLAAGMNGFIAKPLRLAALRDALASVDGTGTDIDIDFEHFCSIIDGADEEAVEIFADFCSEVPLQIARMVEFASAGDETEFANLAGQLKGSCATFGLVAFSNQIGDLEVVGVSGGLSALPNQWGKDVLETFRVAEAKLRERL